MWPDPSPEVEARMLRTAGGNRAFHNFNNDFTHIRDPNERRRLALAEIDKVPFSWYHIRAVTVAGVGFFTDSYDIFAINLAAAMLGIAYYQDESSKGSIPTHVQVAIKASTSGGTVIGMLAFGWLADVLGRRKMYGVELSIIIASTLAQSLTSGSVAVSFTGVFIFWRIVMGIGIGGDYPLSAIITSEFAPTKWRGAMMAGVFSMQGFGQCAAAIVALITTAAFKDRFLEADSAAHCVGDCQIAADQSWRIIIAVGGVPALLALYYRITIPETPRYTFDVARDIEKGGADIKAYIAGRAEGEVDKILQQKQLAYTSSALRQSKASWADFYAYFSQWSNGKILFGTTMSWLLLDLAFYGITLNNSIVLSAIGYAQGDSLYRTLYNTAVGNLILICAGSIPGYLISILTIDYLGRRNIQIGGFTILTILFCIIGFAYTKLSSNVLLALYIIAQFFFNFGPNCTTFVILGECFPTRYRSTAHGMSAASGKIGAIIAQIIAQPLLTKDAPVPCSGRECFPWFPHLMEIFALFMLLGTLVSFLIPETKLLTLEDIAAEEKPRPLSSSIPNSPHWLSPILKPMLTSPKLRSKKKEIGGDLPMLEEDAALDHIEGSVSAGGRSVVSEDSEAAILKTYKRADSIPLRDVGGLLGGRPIQEHYI